MNNGIPLLGGRVTPGVVRLGETVLRPMPYGCGWTWETRMLRLMIPPGVCGL